LQAIFAPALTLLKDRVRDREAAALRAVLDQGQGRSCNSIKT
jgi:hypothetical protein